MPAIEAVAQLAGLSQSAQNLTFVFGLVFLFFVPVLLFVAGSEHLSIKSREMIKVGYWMSLGQVAIRCLIWLVGAGVGFGLFDIVRVIARLL